MTRSQDRETVLLVGLGSQGRPYLRAARTAGLSVVVIDRASSLQSVKTQLLLDDKVTCVPLGGRADTSDWYLAARSAAMTYRPVGVVAFSEEHVLAAALTADEFGLPSPGLRAATISRNKALQRAVFETNGIPQPSWARPETLEDARGWLRANAPVVGKPLDRGGSSGVRLLDEVGAFDRWHAEQDLASGFLREAFVPGPEFSVEVLVRHGEVIFSNVTEKSTTQPPYFVETAHRAPAVTSATTAEALRTVGRQVVSAIGLSTGIAHVEARLDNAGEPNVMEVAVRTPGDYIMEMIGEAYRIDLFGAVVSLACDLPVTLPDRPSRTAMVMFPRCEGPAGEAIIKRVAAAPEGLVLSTLKLSAEAAVWKDSDSRPGALVLSAPDHASLEHLQRFLVQGMVSVGVEG